MFRRFSDLSRIHFVGIGGAGMSGIAEVLAVSHVDLEVSGCDLVESEATRRLQRSGCGSSSGTRPITCGTPTWWSSRRRSARTTRRFGGPSPGHPGDSAAPRCWAS